MKVLAILVAIAAVASAKHAGPVASEFTAYGYLKNIGIPEAERIQKAEQEFLSQSRIVGGVPAAHGQYPYKAGLISDIVGTTGRGVCGASLITTNRLLTAAHCWYDGQNQAWRVTVVLGSTTLFTGGTRLETSVVVTHPNWFPLLIRNDVAVIYLPSSVAISATIAPIEIPSAAEVGLSFEGVRATVAGFGLTSSGGSISANQFLSHISLNVISNSLCNIPLMGIVQDTHICTSGSGGIGPCGGDSGSALVAQSNGRNIAIGVVSFGIVLGCDIGFPTAYARVTSYRDFVISHM